MQRRISTFTNLSSQDRQRNKALPRKPAGNERSAADVLSHYMAPRESIGFMVREIYRGFARSLQPRIAREGVSIGMWFVLRMLWEENGMTQRQISERVGINAPTVVTAINSMEKAGLVRRAPNREDRRKTNVFLTKRGHRLKDTLWPMAKEVYAVAFKDIDRRELAAMGRTLTKVWANLESEQRPKLGRGG
jgi:DNA-binding MarR family transcriptional regulator